MSQFDEKHNCERMIVLERWSSLEAILFHHFSHFLCQLQLWLRAIIQARHITLMI